MNAGDRVRLKEDSMPYSKGSLGRISSIDYNRDTVYLVMDSDNANLAFDLVGFNQLFELIKTEKPIPVPRSLKDWYKQTTPYVVGGKRYG